MDILSRLSVKSLMRFKLVCKSFNSLISSTYFVKLHLRQSSAPNANPLVIFFPPYNDADHISSLHVKSFLKTPPPTVAEEVQFLRSNWKDRYLTIGSCDGLVCMIGTQDTSDEQQLFWVCFWNPAMKSTSQKMFQAMKSTSQMFQAMKSTSQKMFQTMPPNDDELSYLFVYCGFGYDYVSDTYKVLVLMRNQYAMVFNMGGNSWRCVGCFPPDLTPIEEGKNIFGVHLNGTLNWIVINKINENNYVGNNEWVDFDSEWDNFEWDNGSCMILSFDLNKEEFVRLVLPDTPHKFRSPHLGVLDECLCVSHNDGENFVIWQMKKFGIHESWTKLLSISNDKDLEPRDFPIPFFFPIYRFDKGDFLILPEDFLYNPRTKRLSPLETTYRVFKSCATICCESLISPY
ncbi:F-box/kelch-repeat protein At3g23880-like [Lotus japonicus]|uniref:F-box/kelch-repeat protein At3g23880-like n=1 Tax=Lotus japonicus TaxID=34305 RepID=UPI00258A3639|nr:F-box/kelch-repeat protein At3g23880-like [Lotus japonicus]